MEGSRALAVVDRGDGIRLRPYGENTASLKAFVFPKDHPNPNNPLGKTPNPENTLLWDGKYFPQGATAAPYQHFPTFTVTRDHTDMPENTWVTIQTLLENAPEQLDQAFWAFWHRLSLFEAPHREPTFLERQ